MRYRGFKSTSTEDEMKKYRVEFAYQDFTVRGLHFKKAKRTVKAMSAEDAIRKIETALGTTLIDPEFTEVSEQPQSHLDAAAGSEVHQRDGSPEGPAFNQAEETESNVEMEMTQTF